MKTFVKISGRFVGSVLLLATICWSAAAQEGARLNLDGLSRMETNASQTIDVNLSGNILQMGLRILSAQAAKKPEYAKIQEAVAGLKGIYVKSYAFEADNSYAPADLDQIRTQLRTGNWERMAGVRSKKNGQNVEVFTLFEGDRIGGLAVVATDVRHVTVVNIVGMVDIEKLMALQGSLGIPRVDITVDPKEKEKE